MTTLEFISKDQEVHSLLLDSTDDDNKFCGMYMMGEQEKRYNLLRESCNDDKSELFFESSMDFDICVTIYNVTWFTKGQGDFQYITSFPLSSKSISFYKITNTRFKLGKSYLIEIEPY